MGKHTKEYYISVDIEADGPCPGVNSMLQLVAVFYDDSGKIYTEYKANILEIENAVQNPSTMKWWADQEKKRPGTWDRMMTNRIPGKLAMERFRSHVKQQTDQLNASPLVVAFPSGFDFTYLYWYCCTFLGTSPVGFSALDLKTIAMAIIQCSYHDSAKRRFPQSWFDPLLAHTHDALDDAKEQMHIHLQMKKALNTLHLEAVSSKTSV